MRRSSLLRVFRPDIPDRSALRSFVAQLTTGCVLVALAMDSVRLYLIGAEVGDVLISLLFTALISGAIAGAAAAITGTAQLDLHRANDHLRQLSHSDPLTGLPNRRSFLEMAEAIPAASIILVIADIDRFKAINDTHGHLAGDAVLCSISRLMQEQLGQLGHLGRIGGEEFGLVVTQGSLSHAVEAVERFRVLLAQTPILCSAGAISVTISAGVAIGRDGLSFNDLYAEADAALYRAKNSGRNRIAVSPFFGRRAGDVEEDAAEGAVLFPDATSRRTG